MVLIVNHLKLQNCYYIVKSLRDWSGLKAKFEANRLMKALRMTETKGIMPEKANAQSHTHLQSHHPRLYQKLQKSMSCQRTHFN